ncbi:hypothetical protein B0O99DRAFT_206948 [Bisporella sp. PMI_857]|nr:hypothetical protein B0O99DRAFT_206948 [Bisporella sp. PMI_857]
MVSLMALPNELLEIIIRHTSGHTFLSLDQPSLKALSLTCSHLHAMVEPYLYSMFRQNSSSAQSVTHLLRTLLSRPNLAKHFRGISLETPACLRVTDMRFLKDDDLSAISAMELVPQPASLL